MISNTHKLIVIHTPRCGGTSIEEAFDDMTGHHMPASWYAKHHPKEWETYRRVGLCRHPESRFLSLWRYWSQLRAGSWGRKEDVLKRLRCAWRYRATVGTSLKGLSKGVERLRGQDWTDGHFLAQSEFLDMPGIDILPCGEAHKELEKSTGVSIGHANASPALSEECEGWKETVRTLYEKDYSLCDWQ